MTMTDEELKDRLAIGDRLAACTQAGDARKADAYAECFTEDGVLQLAEAISGREAIRQWMTAPSVITQPRDRPPGFISHHLTTCKIELAGDGTAKVRTYWLVTSAAGLAAGLVIACLFGMRCLHPPGAALALVAVVGGPQIEAAGFALLYPVAFNSFLLVAVALIYNNLTGHSYPKARPVKGGIRITYPFLRGLDLSAFKASRVARLKKAGYSVVFFGDGPNDFKAAKLADKAYAAGRLLKLCRERGVAASPLTDFMKAARHMERDR